MKTSILLLLLATSAFAQTLFTDSFNRTDAPNLGSPWQYASTNGQPFSVQNGAATFAHPDAHGVMYLLGDFSLPITIETTLTQTSGFGGLPNRYSAGFSIFSTGLHDGYRIDFYRGDSNYADSAIALYDGATEIGRVNSSFQYGAGLTISVSFFLDGSVVGSVSDGSNAYNFSFGAHTIASAGQFISFGAAGPDSRSSTYIFPTFDNVSITAIPEPVTTTMILGTGVAFFAVWRRRKSSSPNQTQR